LKSAKRLGKCDRAYKRQGIPYKNIVASLTEQATLVKPTTQGELMSNLKRINANANIFIIDDEPIIVSMLQSHLTKAGYENGHGFTDPVEAIDTLKKITPDLIVTDLRMPELGGRFLTKLIRQERHLIETPIIVITAEKPEAIVDYLAKHEVAEVVSKPINEGNFIKAVDEAIEKHVDGVNQRLVDKLIERRISQENFKIREKNVRAVFNRS